VDGDIYDGFWANDKANGVGVYKPNMRESGKMTYNMGKELKLGLMAQDMKEITPLVGNTVLVLINGMMDRNIQVIGKRTRFQGSVFTHG
jgi:hypothetical protein